MVKTHKKGYRLECKVRNYFKKIGFFVVRQAKSAFPDIVAINKDTKIFCECKNRKKGDLSKKEKQKLLTLSEKYDGIPLLCTNDRGKLIFFILFYNGNRIIKKRVEFGENGAIHIQT